MMCVCVCVAWHGCGTVTVVTSKPVAETPLPRDGCGARHQLRGSKGSRIAVTFMRNQPLALDPILEARF